MATTSLQDGQKDALNGKRILLGISGGIAAYKAPQLVRLLRQADADVQVVMTAGAHHFVTATSLQAVSGRPVRDDLWDQSAEAAMGHIELARWADAILVAPATADLIARLATGRADDLLTTLCLASRAPLLIAPAMNQVMWESPSTQRNIRAVVGDGGLLLGPDNGDQACGDVGPGRMQEPAALVGALQAHLAPPRQGLKGKKVLITAGPTVEAIDPVRYLTNHSSGKQGYAIAAAARAAGAEVVLVSGPVALVAPFGVRRIDVTSATEMHDAVLAHAGDCDVFVGVAAVADYRPEEIKPQKIKKTEHGADPANGADRAGGLTLALVENPDIIASVAKLARKPLTVGFAAETHAALEHARSKRERKGIDIIVVNDVSDTSIGFNSDHNAVTIIWQGGEMALPRQPKAQLAGTIIDTIGDFVDQLASANPERVAKQT
jgi:phosphopantothenoylcysteine decarboxylase/phosphopantothenate--cysteine ligase